MKVHSLLSAAMLAATAAAIAAATIATSGAAAADGTIIALDRRYSEQELAAICALENAAFYRGVEGRYGCTNGENNVDCEVDGACIGYLGEMFAVAEEVSLEAEKVLRMPTRTLKTETSDKQVGGIDVKSLP